MAEHVALEQISAIIPLPATIIAAAAFAPLAGTPPLARAVRMLRGGVPDPGIVVAAASTLLDDARGCLASHGLSSVGLVAVEGPGLRAHCVSTALDYLAETPNPPRHVLTHDVRRPLASAELRDRVSAGLRAGASVVMPVLPLTDSVKAVDVNGSVAATLERSVLQAVQYPRGFTVDQLSALLAQRTSDDFDELEEALGLDVPITAVEGEPDAFVTQLPRDSAFVEAIIACRGVSDR
jgi:2-C-methyl-D-erythritol 4-phosphate cytidylyltransferase